MTTKIRLALDLGLQLVLFLVFGCRIWWYPQQIWQELGIFVLLISCWQILHALYVSRKYKNWEKIHYLDRIKQVIAYSLLTLGVGGLMYVGSFGLLSAFFMFLVDMVYTGICAVVACLAVHSFALSIKNLYNYYVAPRSFWDL
jgi:hypothetical protein